MTNTDRIFNTIRTKGEAQVQAFFTFAAANMAQDHDAKAQAKVQFDAATAAYQAELDDMTPRERMAYDGWYNRNR